MRVTAVPGSRRRGLRGCAALASAATLTALTAALATGSPPALAALNSHHPGAITPDATSTDSQLNGVSAESATDAWAVGSYLPSNDSTPLILHWNGTAWKVVKSPAPSGSTGGQLNGVSAVSAADAWAVGYGSYFDAPDEPLTLHWNGTAWKVVKSPAPSGSTNTQLNGVSADSATDAWAAGWYDASGVGLPLILHWNGTVWKAVKSPAPSGSTFTQLLGVSADSATDAWAVGSYESSSGSEPLILHWNGTAWTKMASPVPSGATGINLSGVSAVSATDAWAAGYYNNSSNVAEPLILHWNGTVWKVVKSPAPSGATGINLYGVSADSATDAWAVGNYGGSTAFEPLTLHWNGTAWKVAKSPAPSGTTNTQLLGVSADSATDAWAVGDENSPGLYKTLTLHWNGTAWKQVPSPNGS
jgi:hypothetical protein